MTDHIALGVHNREMGGGTRLHVVEKNAGSSLLIYRSGGIFLAQQSLHWHIEMVRIAIDRKPVPKCRPHGACEGQTARTLVRCIPFR